MIPVLQRARLVPHWAGLEVKYSEWEHWKVPVVVAGVWEWRQGSPQGSRFLGYSGSLRQGWNLSERYSVEIDIYTHILFGGLFSLCRQPHPIWSVYGGQSVQVRHGELQPAFPQVVIYVHHPRQWGRATECISPRLWVGERTYDETRWEWLPLKSVVNDTVHRTKQITCEKNKKTRKPACLTLSNVTIPAGLWLHTT